MYSWTYQLWKSSVQQGGLSELYLRVSFWRTGILTKLWGWAQDNVNDSDMKVKIGVQTKIQIFSFFYGLQLAIVVLFHPDNFSSSLQRAELCAVYAQNNAKLSVTVLWDIRSTGMQASIGPRSLKLLWSWSYKHLHFHVAVRCHQGILRAILNLSTILM